jgi:methanethiol S-methyltransferase
VSDLIDFIIRFVLFASLHSLLAMQLVQRYICRPMGRFARGYRLAYNFVAVVSFGWVMTAFPHSGVLYRIPGTAGLLCHLSQLILLVLLCRCASQVGIGNFIGVRQLRGETTTPTLITDGCYGLVRHPQYGLAVLFFLSNPVMTMRWLVLTGLATLYFIIGAYIEEKRMVDVFGHEYRAYQNRVPMFIPGTNRGT